MKNIVFSLICLQVFLFGNVLIDKYELQCKDGNVDACGVVGGIYQFAFDSYGVKQDFKKAKNFYEIGCSGGNYRSCNNLGFMYEKAQGVKQNFKKAFELYEKSCNGGDRLGCNNLSSLKMNKNNSADTKDLDRIFKSCENGEFISCANIGLISLEIGDVNNAVAYYSKACLLGEKDKNIHFNNELKNLWNSCCALAFSLIKQLEK